MKGGCPALLGTDKKPLREATVLQSASKQLAIRQGPWKLVIAPKGGHQPYNLKDDIGESDNIASDHPEVVKSLLAIMKRYIAHGRSTSGAKQPREPEVKWPVP